MCKSYHYQGGICPTYLVAAQKCIFGSACMVDVGIRSSFIFLFMLFLW